MKAPLYFYPLLKRLSTVLWYAFLVWLTLIIYSSYGGMVEFVTSGGAGWQGFLLAFSSVFPCQALLWIYNHIVRKSFHAGWWLEVIMDALCLTLIFYNIDYHNLQFIDY